MTGTMEIPVTKVERSKLNDIPLENIPFGKYFTDHMLEADYENGEWKNVEIKPYQPMLLDPSTAALHYGQAIFEGIKAYKYTDGTVAIFRPMDNFKRFNISAERMQMPTVPEEIFMEGMRLLINLEEAYRLNQDLVAGIHIERERQQQAAGGAGGYGDPLRGYFSGKDRRVMRGDRLAQRGQPERRGVCAAALAQRPQRRLDHLRRRGEIRLADLHVDHAPARRLELLGAREHVHHDEGLDVGGTPGGFQGQGEAMVIIRI